ncbi:MAG: hypothetical protein L0Y74_01285 [candidate division Zixibacteria bacterium]|nr:hypothetical protein [candidate division Zixibacteria bacterium]
MIIFQNSLIFRIVVNRRQKPLGVVWKLISAGNDWKIAPFCVTLYLSSAKCGISPVCKFNTLSNAENVQLLARIRKMQPIVPVADLFRGLI